MYSVTFDSDGGSTVKAQSVKHGETISEPDAPKKDGYRFDGWYTEKDEKWNFENAIAGDLTLYAKWVEQVIVTFDSNGGSEVNPVTVDKGQTVSMPNNPTKEDYSFVKWTTEDGEDFTSNTKVYASVTLYAVWATDINKNGVDDEKETITINVNQTGDGTVGVKIGAEDGNSYVYDSTKYSPADFVVTVTATPDDGWYVDSISGGELSFTTGRAGQVSFTASETCDVSVVLKQASLTATSSEMNYYVGQTITDMRGSIAEAIGLRSSPAELAKNATIEYLAATIDLSTLNLGSFPIWADPATVVSVDTIVEMIYAEIENPLISKEAVKKILSGLGIDELYHQFGDQETEQIRVTYDGNAQYPELSVQVTLTLKDLRKATEITCNDVTVTYNPDGEAMEAEILENLGAKVLVTEDGQSEILHYCKYHTRKYAALI